jgi:RNA polymerase sigma factor (sigma-70 family)
MPNPARTLLLRHQDDRRLARLVQAGDDGAFEVVVGRYRRALLRHCERIAGTDHAEDVLQHTLINAHRALRRGDDVVDLGPWLHRIAHNAALSSLRTRQHDEPLDAAARSGAASESAADAVERRERLRETVASVRDLPARQRQAIVMHVGDDRSYDEISAQLGISPGAVKQLLSRARGTLRRGVTAITPCGLLLRNGAAEAEAFAGLAACCCATAPRGRGVRRPGGRRRRRRPARQGRRRRRHRPRAGRRRRGRHRRGRRGTVRREHRHTHADRARRPIRGRRDARGRTAARRCRFAHRPRRAVPHPP